MGQVGTAFQLDSEFEAFSELDDAKASVKLRCIVMCPGDAFPMLLDAAQERSKFELNVVRTQTIVATREAMDQCDPDLVILAKEVSDGDGLEFARTLTADARTYDIPVIMLTDEDAENIAIDVLRAGAADCLSGDVVTHEAFDQAVENALRRRKRNPADQLATISNLESENATLRRIALRNMRLLKTETLPLLSFAWQALQEKALEPTEEKRLAQRLSRVTRTMMGLIDDTVITSATHRALDIPAPVDLRSIASKIIADDCGEIRLSSAHFKLNELPHLFARETIVAMLFEELFVSMVRNARLGNVPEIEVGTSQDPNGNLILWFTDSGVPLSARKQALSQRLTGLNDLGSPKQDALSWSLCQRLTEKCGGEFKVSETATGQVRISLRFPSRTRAPAGDLLRQLANGASGLLTDSRDLIKRNAQRSLSLVSRPRKLRIVRDFPSRLIRP